MDATVITLPTAPAREAITAGALSQQEWAHVVKLFEFSPQQARLVKLILENKPDKQIVRETSLRRPTIRTYLSRIFQRTGATDRVGLVLAIFAAARQWRDQRGDQLQ
jgi:DNA-binding CsgD family transcriptional regulator